MKVKISGIETVNIKGEYIKLEALLKFTGAVETGGEAKLAINEGRVRRNGRICLQRGGKLRHGDIVGYDGFLWRISGGNADK